MLLIGPVLADAAALRPHALAATCGTAAVTFAEADAGANRTANTLAARGVRAGDVVAWWTDGSLRSIDGFFGSARLGAVFSPLAPGWSPDEATAVLEYLEPRALVVDAAHEEAGRAAGRSLDVEVIPLADTGPGSAAAPVPSRPIAETDPHVIYLTSGTTGRPKGVAVSHRASWLRSFPGGGTFSLALAGRDGGILTSFPVYHYGGFHYVLEAWLNRCPVHVVARADAAHLLDSVARWRPAGMYCIPAVWSRVLDAAGPLDGGADLRSIHHADSGTSATPVEFLRRIKDRLPQATTSVFYGSSEGGHHTTLADWDVERKPGSVGRAAPPLVVRLDEQGQVCVRGETLMNGYHRLPEETAAALQDGWYLTGDLGSLDDEGYLYVTGRLREVIRTGGETVPPVEVEAALADYPGLAEVAVVGLPDESWGEIVCAAVVMVPGAVVPTVADLRAHVEGRLARHKHPRRVVAVDAIPRTGATGQVQRTLVRETVVLQDEGQPR